MLYITDLVGIHVGNPQQIGQLIHLFLRQLTLIDNDSIIHITTLDQISVQQGDDITDKHKGSCGSNLLCIVIHIVECSKLAADKLRLERAHCGDGEIFIRKYCDAGTTLFVFHLNLMPDDIVVFRGILFGDTHFLNFLDIRIG